MKDNSSLESYFNSFRDHILGINKRIKTPFSEEQALIYTDWTASGRAYGPIEELLVDEVYPLVANTHTETNFTGKAMTLAYHQAQNIIKKHVNASPEDVVICSNSGMTGVLNKFIRILGYRIHENYAEQITVPQEDRPVVFITHMEHHSNQTTWLETICDLEIIQPCGEGLVNLEHLKELLAKYEGRKTKIASVTACSNVTGIQTPYHEIAEMMHQVGGLCFVDFACSAPYVDMNMHPDSHGAQLDAIFFSPHKFLGGPGSTGILVFNKKLYNNSIPDEPGGGTVEWTNPWKEHRYIADIETREDGGTPAFLQTIRAAMAIKLKEKMGVANILKREHEQLDYLFPKLKEIKGLHILAPDHQDRLAIISFYVEGLHHNLAVKMLNDRFGIQVRGGCSCAGTYGHFLLHVTPEHSCSITDMIDQGDLSRKPGWIRLSLHPTTTNEELKFIVEALKQLAAKHQQWAEEYDFNPKTYELEYCGSGKDAALKELVCSWFDEMGQAPSHAHAQRVLKARKTLVSQLISRAIPQQ